MEYLKRGVKTSGRGGVFKAKISRDDIPDGWLEDSDDGSSKTADHTKGKTLFYSATF